MQHTHVAVSVIKMFFVIVFKNFFKIDLNFY